MFSKNCLLRQKNWHICLLKRTSLMFMYLAYLKLCIPSTYTITCVCILFIPLTLYKNFKNVLFWDLIYACLYAWISQCVYICPWWQEERRVRYSVAGIISGCEPPDELKFFAKASSVLNSWATSLIPKFIVLLLIFILWNLKNF